MSDSDPNSYSERARRKRGGRFNQGGRLNQGDGRTDEERRASELQQSVARFEEAVQELARNAANDMAGRASGLIDDTTRRIQQAVDGRGLGANDFRETRYAHDEHRVGEGPVPTARLYLDHRNRRIGGVCSGFAKYFDMEPWVARCIAVTGLVFLPTIVMPAYWIAYWLLDNEPSLDAKRRARREARRGRSKRWRRKGQALADKLNGTDDKAANENPRRARDYSPKRILRYVRADLTSAELRLRRIERHVTSDRYELGKQFNAL